MDNELKRKCEYVEKILKNKEKYEEFLGSWTENTTGKKVKTVEITHGFLDDADDVRNRKAEVYYTVTFENGEKENYTLKVKCK